MTYRVIYTDLGTERIHFPIEMDLKKDDKTMEYVVHIPEQRLRISMMVASDEPVWVGETKWDRAEELKPKKQKRDYRELPMLGEAYW